MHFGAWLAIAVFTGVSVVCLTPDRGVSQDTARSSSQATDALAAFDRIASVLQSPRCLNFHPRGDRPTQGDDRHIHRINVQRGIDGNGMPAMRCNTCHQDHNNDMAGIPGAPHWHLAPATMGWVGLSKAELCRTVLDRNKNGGRSVADLVAHITGDTPVRWAWEPGPHRSPPPLTIDDLKAALDAWAQASAPCPD
jgi:hypothetical protein